MELMQHIPDKSVDMILCDLPYGTTACSWDTILPLDDLWKHYERIIKDDGAIVLTASQPFASKLIMSRPNLFRYEIIWDKVIPSNFQLMNFQFGKIHENILIFSKSPAVFCNEKHMKYYPQRVQRNNQRITKKIDFSNCNVTLRKGHTIKDSGKKVYNERLPISIVTYSNADRKNKIHPTQKPIDLFRYLIKTYTQEGELVLDNCIGSGTTAVACKQTNRKFIGIELNQEYVDITNERLKQKTVSGFNPAKRQESLIIVNIH